MAYFGEKLKKLCYYCECEQLFFKSFSMQILVIEKMGANDVVDSNQG
jgi:hypothetical protein